MGTVEILTFEERLGVKNLLSRINQTDGKGLVRSYDANNNLISNTDAEGTLTTYGYNVSHQRTTTTQASGTPDQRITQISYLSPDLDLPTLITKPSVVAGQSFQMVIQYNLDYTVQSITLNGYRPDGTTISRSTTFQYNIMGQVTQIDGPLTALSDVTHLTYHDCFTGAQCGQLAILTNALGQTHTFDQYDARGQLLKSTDANGLVTEYQYDLRGRVTQVKQQASAGHGRTRLTTYQYDAAGQLIQLTLPDGNIFHYHYDAAHDLRRITDALGNQIEYAYDVKGNRTAERYKDPDGTLQRELTLAYDHRNRLQTLNEAGSITQLIHNAVGQLTQSTDPNDNPPETYQYDPLHRLQSTLDALGQLSQYQYDAQDRVIQVTSPNSASTNYVYDDLGNLLQESSPDRGIITYQHDSAGNIIQSTDARGVITTYQYDSLNRLIQVNYPEASENLSYQYDTGDDCVLAIGRLCQVTGPAGTTTYQYDAFGNLTREQQQHSGQTTILSYQYDAGDRLTRMTLADGSYIDYTRNVLGHIQQVKHNDTPVIADQHHDALGQIIARTLGNGESEHFQFDLKGQRTQTSFTPAAVTEQIPLLNRLSTIILMLTLFTLGRLSMRKTAAHHRLNSLLLLTSLCTLGSLSPGSAYGIQNQHQHTYDANGNLIQLITPQGTTDYQYDALDRLIKENSDDYVYDTNGNRTQDATQSYQYHPGSNRLNTQNSQSLAHDAAGNLIDDGHFQYHYNQAGRLKEITQAGTTVAQYRYDHRGLRTDKTINGNTSRYIYNLAGHLIQEIDHHRRTTTYLWQDDIPVAIKQPDGTLLYLHTDHLNTPRSASNETGTTVWRWNSDAFGLATPDQDPDNDGHPTVINLRFPGQYYDAESGLHYNYHRYYDPYTGRYITSDPIGLAGGLNTYLYANANPLYYTDPYGLFGMDDVWGGVYSATGGWSPDQSTVDFAAGFGDSISFNLTKHFRHSQGICNVDYDANSYGYGNTSGTLFGLANAGRTGLQVYKGLSKARKWRTSSKTARKTRAKKIAAAGSYRPSAADATLTLVGGSGVDSLVSLGTGSKSEECGCDD